jgi:hypothetical protein
MRKWPSSVLDSFDTRWLAATAARSEAANVTAWRWADVPWMPSVSAEAAESWTGHS